MAISVTKVQGAQVPGSEKFTVTDVELDADYATGGYAVTPEDLGLQAVDFAICTLKTPSTDDPVESAALVAGQLICFADGAEVADDTTDDLSDAVIQVVAFGY